MSYAQDVNVVSLKVGIQQGTDRAVAIVESCHVAGRPELASELLRLGMTADAARRRLADLATAANAASATPANVASGTAQPAAASSHAGPVELGEVADKRQSNIAALRAAVSREPTPMELAELQSAVSERWAQISGISGE